METTKQATPSNPVDTYQQSPSPEGPMPKYIPKKIAIVIVIAIVVFLGFLIFQELKGIGI